MKLLVWRYWFIVIAIVAHSLYAEHDTVVRRVRSKQEMHKPHWLTDATEFERDLQQYYPEHGWVCRLLQQSSLPVVIRSLESILRLLGDRSSRWFYTVDAETLYREELVIDDLVGECAAYEQWLQQARIDGNGVIVLVQQLSYEQKGISLLPMVIQSMPMVLAEFYQAYFELLGLQALPLLQRLKYERDTQSRVSIARQLRKVIQLKLAEIATFINTGLQLPPQGQIIAQRMTYHTARLYDLINQHLHAAGFYTDDLL
ncbi:hypothetical protein M1466_02775 [Candidatus Dependentiae bacterium]|nr:hypothetical protein [Candidatus Dependentiae bacterium]